jgi:SPP1 gp7 family putative phage head morphogenesis protein
LSSNTFMIDAASRHSVLLQRYSAGLEAGAADSVSAALNGVVSDLATLEGRNKRSLRLQIVSNYRSQLTSLEAELYDELIELAGSEDDFSVEMFEEAINATIDAVDDNVLVNAVDNANIDVVEGQRITIPQMLSQFTAAKSRQINTILQDGFTEGLTQDQLISRVREAQPLQRRQAASLVRTGTNAVSSIARYESMLANSDVLKGYEWVSTLDSRTSNVCIARDGVVYSFKKSNPKPPAHFSCRSTIVPKVDPRYDLLSDVTGDRPSIGADGVEQVNAQSTYGGWLRKQPAIFQNEVLGPARAKLFRQGGLSVSKFVNFDGKTYTLDELRALNPLAFEKANL